MSIGTPGRAPAISRSIPCDLRQTLPLWCRNDPGSNPEIRPDQLDCKAELPLSTTAGLPTPDEQHVLSEDYEFRESALRYDVVSKEFHLHISTR